MYTEQETFDMVVAHFKTMLEPAIVNGRCKYRTPNGNKCFAGALIPDHLYDEKMEGDNANGPRVGPVLKAIGYEPTFVKKLQSAHDRAALIHPMIWRQSARSTLWAIAQKHGLDTSLLDA